MSARPAAAFRDDGRRRLDRPDVAAAIRGDGGALLDRAAGWFVAPRLEAVPAVPHALGPRDVARAVVLGTAGDAPPVAAALAGALRAGARAPGAVAAVWSPRTQQRAAPAGGEPARPAFPAARRLAARLAARDVDAVARGRLAWVALPAAGDDAVACVGRVGAVGVPFVLALAGPRAAELDCLLAEQDLIVVVAQDVDGPLARLALAGLAELPVVAVACRPLYGAVRLLALAGLAGARALDQPLRVALRRLG